MLQVTLLEQLGTRSQQCVILKWFGFLFPAYLPSLLMAHRSSVQCNMIKDATNSSMFAELIKSKVFTETNLPLIFNDIFNHWSGSCNMNTCFEFQTRFLLNFSIKIFCCMFKPREIRQLFKVRRVSFGRLWYNLLIVREWGSKSASVTNVNKTGCLTLRTTTPMIPHCLIFSFACACLSHT